MAAEPCPICLEEIDGECVIQCQHLFCFKCIHNWTRTNNSCPTCRNPIEWIADSNNVMHTIDPPKPQTQIFPQDEELARRIENELNSQLVSSRLSNLYNRIRTRLHPRPSIPYDLDNEEDPDWIPASLRGEVVQDSELFPEAVHDEDSSDVVELVSSAEMLEYIWQKAAEGRRIRMENERNRQIREQQREQFGVVRTQTITRTECRVQFIPEPTPISQKPINGPHKPKTPRPHPSDKESKPKRQKVKRSTNDIVNPPPAAAPSPNPSIITRMKQLGHPY